MQVDKTTLHDLSIFHKEEEQSVFFKLNHTQTNEGKEFLKKLIAKPLDNLNEIIDTQNTINELISLKNKLPKTITNGTIMVLESFFETAIDNYPIQPNIINSIIYKIFSASDFSLTKYTVNHFIGFLHDLYLIAKSLKEQHSSHKLILWADLIESLLKRPSINEILAFEKKTIISDSELLKFGRFLKHHYKEQCFKLLDIYNQLDAYLSLATACELYTLHFPEIKESKNPYLKTEGLYHLLLENPVCYSIDFDEQKNFLFLTGANMAGKSTFIKGIGISVYLAHIGIGVPAKSMKLSLFDGLLTNIQVEDNLLKGESFFFNEVQRIKRTVDKLGNKKKWMILIDELFKGTNVQDAMKCSTSVIEGLRKTNDSLFVLSTHLYEIADGLMQFNNIDFKYFETRIEEKKLHFSYQLQNGVSNDRLGFLILEREGVVEMLNKL